MLGAEKTQRWKVCKQVANRTGPAMNTTQLLNVKQSIFKMINTYGKDDTVSEFTDQEGKAVVEHMEY
jgi:hypothetical protein